VVIVARRPEPIDALVAELGERVTGIVADVADPERARAVVDEAHARLGKLDLVIANAGIGINAPAHELRLEHVIPVLQLNVLGACATLTAAIPHLLAGGGGLDAIMKFSLFVGAPDSKTQVPPLLARASEASFKPRTPTPAVFGTPQTNEID
jgi:NAD(P)-dependent dehydrogenase (short-subunit alcohol dehydrogenase family)